MDAVNEFLDYEENYEEVKQQVSHEEYISQRIRDQVSECLWLNDINQKNQLYNSPEKDESKKYGALRCIVCTLPEGTCMHTATWIRLNYVSAVKEQATNALENELNSVLGVLDNQPKIETKLQQENIDLSTIKWTEHTPRFSDKIGDTSLPLSLPSERGWHSLERVGKYMVLFGGVRFRNNISPKPFSTPVHIDDIEYLNDVYLYDVVNLAWHILNPKSNVLPCGRYGHASACLDSRRMLIFGGRTVGGRYLGDTWILDIATCEWIDAGTHFSNTIGTSPSPRSFSASVKSPSKDEIILFGGTNGHDNLGDIWVFRWGQLAFQYDISTDMDESDTRSGTLGPLSKEMLWTRGVAVGGGAAPSPRYGHRLVAIQESTHGKKKDSLLSNLRCGSFIAVIGGCAVSPISELEGKHNSLGGGGGIEKSEVKNMLKLSQTLQRLYDAEGSAAIHGGQVIANNVQMKSSSESLSDGSAEVMNLRDINHRTSNIAGRIAEMERETRLTEIQLAESLRNSQAVSLASNKRAVHPFSKLDTYFLNVDDMAWVPQIYPKISGEIPFSRMYFQAVAIGDYIFVLGGVSPTSLMNRLVDETGYTVIHALNLMTLVWTSPSPMNTTQHLDIPLQIAETEIMRAKQKVIVEKNNGMSFGARGGLTVELAEAEAMLNVAKWRKKVLLQEQAQLSKPPIACFGMAAALLAGYDGKGMSSRAIFHGGWGSHGGEGGINAIAVNASKKQGVRPKEVSCCLVLDLEQEMERRRRLDEEFHAKLERDMQESESKALQNKVQTLFELRFAKEQEIARQQKETKQMEFEDFMSSLPPLSQPSKVKFVKCNEHTIWVKWARSTMKSNRKRAKPGEVTYYLYASGGYVTYHKGDRVTVSPLTRNINIKNEESDIESQEGSVEDDDSTISSFSIVAKKKTNIIQVPYNGTITSVNSGGKYYTILADDGAIMKRVERSQLSPNPPATAEELAMIENMIKKNKLKSGISQSNTTKLTKIAPMPPKEIPDLVAYGKNWRLLYKGEDTEYACECLVPRYALQREPGVTVRVQFAIRTTGIDYLSHEFSQLSVPVEFSTQWPPDLNVVEKIITDTLEPKTAVTTIPILVGSQKIPSKINLYNNEVTGEGSFDHFL